ncbi:PREDICTED: uncharacterized protein LOC108538061 [Rhinopithecus bieti]|uniref:uncharacterized protein LOC108538061 n=1 Tax=Rhinopithecus bieti TaxID=61621 RepID=UPI00083C0B6B|nr:PREDICTED: uncharacterized protein LOC108538061 [Rhinopithecus bieti]
MLCKEEVVKLKKLTKVYPSGVTGRKTPVDVNAPSKTREGGRGEGRPRGSPKGGGISRHRPRRPSGAQGGGQSRKERVPPVAARPDPQLHPHPRLRDSRPAPNHSPPKGGRAGHCRSQGAGTRHSPSAGSEPPSQSSAPGRQPSAAPRSRRHLCGSAATRRFSPGATACRWELSRHSAGFSPAYRACAVGAAAEATLGTARELKVMETAAHQPHVSISRDPEVFPGAGLVLAVPLVLTNGIECEMCARHGITRWRQQGQIGYSFPGMGCALTHWPVPSMLKTLKAVKCTFHTHQRW